MKFKNQTIIGLIVLLLVSSILLALPTSHFDVQAASLTLEVDAEKLNMRQGPGLSYPVISSLKEGDRLNVHDSKDEWLKVEAKGKVGWVASWMTRSTQKKEKDHRASTVAVSTTNGLNIRSGPSMQHPSIGKIDAGKQIDVQSTQGDWAYVKVDGMYGWVYRSYLSQVNEKTIQSNKQKASSKQTAKDQFHVAVSGLNVRSEPTLQSNKVTVIYEDEVYPINERKGNWLQIKLDDGSKGWVYAFHGTIGGKVKSKTGKNIATTLTEGTNLRAQPTTNSDVVLRVGAGEQFTILNVVDKWYEVALQDGQTAYLASWVVSSNAVKKKEKRQPVSERRKKATTPGTLNGISIVIDAGHGGHDRGTTGVRGTREKDLTLWTAESLASKLKEAGAQVTMTRNADEYVSLRSRVALREEMNADAFISLHYDANTDPSIRGFTTYYYTKEQRDLARSINTALEKNISLSNRGNQVGNYLVIRENTRDAVLIELGFLTNAAEEQIILTKKYREQATYGIYTGILNFFND